VSVRKGNKLSRGQRIGFLTDENGKGNLHLEVWKGKNKLDPQAWIK
jgi:septal ring factor EnvC (AmiA/AmiB activator)